MKDTDELTSSALSELEAEKNRILHQTLVDAGLVDDDPESETDLVFPLPEGARIVSIVQSYDTKKTTGNKIRCAACLQHQPHNRGFRVLLDTGQKVRIGINCGEDKFGIGAWKTAKVDYDRRVKAATYQARIKPALDAITQIMPLVEGWHVQTKLLAKSITLFRTEMPDLFKRLSVVAKTNEGRLTREKRVKSKHVNRLGKSENHNEIQTTTIGRIPFPGTFLGATPNSGLSGARGELGRAVALLSNKSDTKSLERAFNHIHIARQHLNEAAILHRDALQNLAEGWISGLCEWARYDDELTANYVADGRVIVHSEGGIDSWFEFATRVQIGEPPIESINQLWP